MQDNSTHDSEADPATAGASGDGPRLPARAHGGHSTEPPRLAASVPSQVRLAAAPSRTGLTPFGLDPYSPTIAWQDYEEPPLVEPHRIAIAMLAMRFVTFLWVLSVVLGARSIQNNGLTIDASDGLMRRATVGFAVVFILAAVSSTWCAFRAVNVHRLDGRLPSIARCVTAWAWPFVVVVLGSLVIAYVPATEPADVRPFLTVMLFFAAMWRPYSLMRRLLASLTPATSNPLLGVAYVLDVAGIGVLWWQVLSWGTADVITKGRVDVLFAIGAVNAMAVLGSVGAWYLIVTAVRSAELYRRRALRTRHTHRMLRLQGIDPLNADVWWAMVHGRLGAEAAKRPPEPGAPEPPCRPMPIPASHSPVGPIAPVTPAGQAGSATTPLPVTITTDVWSTPIDQPTVAPAHAPAAAEVAVEADAGTQAELHEADADVEVAVARLAPDDGGGVAVAGLIDAVPLGSTDVVDRAADGSRAGPIASGGDGFGGGVGTAPPTAPRDDAESDVDRADFDDDDVDSDDGVQPTDDEWSPDESANGDLDVLPVDELVGHGTHLREVGADDNVDVEADLDVDERETSAEPLDDGDEYDDDEFDDDLDSEYDDDEFDDDLDSEYDDDEYADDEYADDEYADDEYADDEYADEYTDDEYTDDEYDDDLDDDDPELAAHREHALLAARIAEVREYELDLRDDDYDDGFYEDDGYWDDDEGGDVDHDADVARPAIRGYAIPQRLVGLDVARFLIVAGFGAATVAVLWMLDQALRSHVNGEFLFRSDRVDATRFAALIGFAAAGAVSPLWLGLVGRHLRRARIDDIGVGRWFAASAVGLLATLALAMLGRGASEFAVVGLLELPAAMGTLSAATLIRLERSMRIRVTPHLVWAILTPAVFVVIVAGRLTRPVAVDDSLVKLMFFGALLALMWLVLVVLVALSTRDFQDEMRRLSGARRRRRPR